MTIKTQIPFFGFGVSHADDGDVIVVQDGTLAPFSGAADGDVLTWDAVADAWVSMAGAFGAGSLAATLLVGNTTGTRDIDITAGQAIDYQGDIDLQRQGTTLLSATAATAIVGSTGVALELSGSNAGRVTVQTAGVDRMDWSNVRTISYLAEFRFDSGAVAPSINQGDETGAVNADDLSLQAQNNTNAGAFNGGSLRLVGGTTVGGAPGNVVLNLAGGDEYTFSSTTADFTANNLVTTGDVSVGATPATAGDLRVNQGFSLQARNNAGSADLNVLTFGVSGADAVQLGNTTGATEINASTAGRVTVLTAGAPRMDWSSTRGISYVAGFRFDAGVVAPLIDQGNETGAVNADDLSIQAQNNTNAGAFNGGNIQLIGGTSVGGSPGTVDFRVPSPALGGGGAATLGAVGAPGPGTTAQNQWLEIAIDGVRHWIPVWV